jgi:hypothetical protein
MVAECTYTVSHLYGRKFYGTSGRHKGKTRHVTVVAPPGRHICLMVPMVHVCRFPRRREEEEKRRHLQKMHPQV